MCSAEARQTVTVMGLGYIGLPTASLLATRGYSVHGVDTNEEVISTVGRGEIHIVEPELDVLVRSAIQSGKLTVSARPVAADVFILAVPTPFTDGKAPDLSYVEAATRSMAGILEPGNLIILESTSPVGTTEQVADWIADERPDLVDNMVNIAHCPERVLPGRIIQELVENDRVVGGVTEAATDAAAAFYQTFVSGQIFKTTARTAEMAKLTENTFRDVNIALANELSLVCDHLDIDVWQVIALANRHPRVNLLQPGPGVGGHCIAVDPWFVIHSAPDQTKLMKTARDVNDAKPHFVVEQVMARASQMRSPTIACLGLAYKPDVDDVRESPALLIVESLARKQVGRLIAVDPYARRLPPSLVPLGIELLSLEQALEEADILVLLVAHRNFLNIKAEDFQQRTIVDACGLMHRVK